MKKLGVSIVVQIWADEKRAIYKASEQDREWLADFFSVAIDAVNDALYEHYETYKETVIKNMKEKTMQSTLLSGSYSHDYTEMVTWHTPDGWKGCLQGVFQGNAFEGEDTISYPTRTECEAELRYNAR